MQECTIHIRIATGLPIRVESDTTFTPVLQIPGGTVGHATDITCHCGHAADVVVVVLCTVIRNLVRV